MGMMPTQKSAESNDYLYRYFRKREYEEYWTIIANILNLDLGTISEDYFHLVTTMIKYDFQRRFTIDEIKDHPWYKGPVATEDEVREELEKRQQIINKRMSDSSDGNDTDEPDSDQIIETHLTAFEEVTRGDDDDWTEEAPLRKIKVYDGAYPKLTEFFSTFQPNVLLGALINFVGPRKIELKVDVMQYKAVIQMPSEEENIVDFTVEILKVKSDDSESDPALADSDDEDCLEDVEDDEDNPDQKYCVSFRKKRGPLADFVQICTKFRQFCGQLNDVDKNTEEDIVYS